MVGCVFVLCFNGAMSIGIQHVKICSDMKKYIIPANSLAPTLLYSNLEEDSMWCQDGHYPTLHYSHLTVLDGLIDERQNKP